jgi:ketol-acid reductoisomerase
VGDETRTAMKKILADIQAGTFAREWINENKTGGKNFAALREAEKKHPVEAVGANLRGMMSWLQKDSGKQAQKAEPTPKKQVVNA